MRNWSFSEQPSLPQDTNKPYILIPESRVTGDKNSTRPLVITSEI